MDSSTENVEDFFKLVEETTTIENTDLKIELFRIKIKIENIDKKINNKKSMHKTKVVREKNVKMSSTYYNIKLTVMLEVIKKTHFKGWCL